MNLERILVTRTDKIGDCLLATPVLEAIRKKFPGSFMSMLIKPYTKDAISGNPNINEIILDDFEDSLAGSLKLAKVLRNKRFDIAIILFPTWKVAFATFLAKISARIGSGYRIYSFLFNKRIYVHRSHIEKHEVEYNFDIVEPLGVKLNNEKVRIFLSEDDLLFADEFFKEKELNNSTVLAIHPGSGGSALNWTAENYAKLADTLAQAESFAEKNVRILITGSSVDKEIVEKVSKIMYKRHVKMNAEAVTIKQLAGIIRKCSLFISSSTGPMHIASAVGTSTLSFFCPIHVCSPIRWGPWGNKNISLVPDGLYCSSCKFDKCKNYNCMERITVESAKESALELLKEVK